MAVYVKRGCGSPYFEFLPLLNHRTFDLCGMEAAHLAVKRVVDRYPYAPKVALGFSFYVDLHSLNLNLCTNIITNPDHQ